MNSLKFNPEQIDELLRAKIEHGQLFLFNTQSMFTVFRPLSVSESEAVLAMSTYFNETYLEDWVIKNTYLTGSVTCEHLLTKEKCFVTKRIALSILKNSNIQEEAAYIKAVEEARTKAGTLQAVVENILSRAYPSMSPIYIKGLSQVKQLSLLGEAENITGQKLTMGRKAKNEELKKWRFDNNAQVIGPDITSPEVADKPEW